MTTVLQTIFSNAVTWKKKFMHAFLRLGPIEWNWVLTLNKYCSFNFCCPFYQHWLKLIPAWISYYTQYNFWDEIIYPFPKFNGTGMDKLLSSHTLLGMWLLIHAGIKAMLVKGVPKGHCCISDIFFHLKCNPCMTKSFYAFPCWVSDPVSLTGLAGNRFLNGLSAHKPHLYFIKILVALIPVVAVMVTRARSNMKMSSYW